MARICVDPLAWEKCAGEEFTALKMCPALCQLAKWNGQSFFQKVPSPKCISKCNKNVIHRVKWRKTNDCHGCFEHKLKHTHDHMYTYNYTSYIYVNIYIYVEYMINIIFMNIVTIRFLGCG